MRLLVLSPVLPDGPCDGDRLRLYHWLRMLGRRHDVTLACFSDPARPGDRVERIEGLRLAALHKVPQTQGQRRRAAALRLGSSLPVTVSSAASGAMARLTDGLLAGGGFDAVLAYRVKMAPYALRWRGPRFLDYCDALTRYHERRAVALRLEGRRLAAAWSRLQARRLAAYEAWCAGQFDGAFFNAAGDRDALAAMHPAAAGRLRVAANGVDAAHFQRPAGRPREAKTLCFVGHLAYAPNAEAVLWFARQVLPRLRAQDPAIRFQVVGGDAPAAVLALAGQPGVELLGFAPDTRPHLWSAALSVCPVHSGAGRQNKVLEAFAAGLPVVATPLAAQVAEAQAGRHLAVADGPEAFAQAVLGLLKAHARAARLAAAAQGLLKARYRWDANAAVLEGAMARAARRPLW
jgi:glycosyltransferase involved in cell wall biosynthesis